MAYAAVASLIQTIDLILSYHQRSITPRFKVQIISIHQHTCSLRSFIEGSSHRVYNWEETIREVTNRAEDIIELLLESSVGSSRSESEKEKYEVSYGLDELEKVKEEIESIASRVIVGGSSSLEVIAICGSGGTGKTALAIEAYVHPLTVERFDVRAGSTNTEEHTWVRLVKDLLLCIREKFSKSNSDVQLIVKLFQILGQRRYLILLDDVWSFEVLEMLKITLPDYGNGSRIIVTTRSFDLANSANHIHEMSLLDEDKSWDLLRDNIFKGDPCPFQLESMGKSIAGSFPEYWPLIRPNLHGTSEGGFSRLIFLRIEECNLEYWVAKGSHFPRLYRLEVVLRFRHTNKFS